MLSQFWAIAAACALAALVLTSHAPPAAAGAATEEPADAKTVLLLHAEARLIPAIVTLDREIRAVLQQSVGHVRFYAEYLDASWFPDAHVEAATVDVLRRKYSAQRLDLVLPVGPAALQFALRHRQTIFPRAPIVFAAAFRPTAGEPELPAGVRGTWLDIDWAGNLALITRLHPETERIALVHGSSAFDRAQTGRFREAFAAYRGRLELLELTDLSFDELLARVAALPPRTVILFYAFLRDRTGRAFIGADVAQRISRVAPVPIYGVGDAQVAAGVIGGKVVSFEALARQSAALAARALGAEPNVPAEDTSVYMFHAGALKRWGIREGRLPPGSLVLNREVSLWERYRGLLIGGAVVVLLEALLIVGLLLERRQRTRAQAALARSLRFEQTVSEISTTLAVVSPAEMEAELQHALLRVARELGFDRASLIELTEDPRYARVTRSVALGDGQPLRATLPLDRFPWTVAALMRGEVVQFPARNRMPAEAERDREAFAELGTEGFMSVPLTVGRTVVGALSLATVRPMRRGPDAVMQRSRLLGEVFANTIVRRRAESAVRESEARFRLMADSAPVMVWMSGTDGGCTYFNRQWLEFTGRRLDQELGAGWAEGVHPDDREQCLERYRKHFQAREEFVLEYRLRRHDGEYRWVVDRGVPRLGRDGTFRGYVGACSDITEIKAAHAAMLEAVSLRSAIFGSLYGHVAALDRAGVIVAVNESWSRFQAEDGWNTIRPPVGADYLAACRQAAEAGDASARQAEVAIHEVLAGHRARASCEYVAHASGEEHWFEMTVEPFNRPEGGAIVTHIDITRRRRAEAEARREREHLAHALRVTTLGELAASLAHEISQPLAAILSNAQAARLLLAKQKIRDDDDVHGALTDIAEDAKRAAHVIRRLRALFRKEWTEQRKPVDVNDIVVEVTGLLHGDLAPKGVELQLSLAKFLPPVFGDAIQLQQVMLNVIVNASEAMVSASTVRPSIAVRTTCTEEGTVEVTIRDRGPGVSEAEIERIFQPFVTTKTTGLGMGLSISRSIVQAHGGRIWATRNDEGGLTVHIELPCEEPEAQP
jgi:PAS domain S-box-containing protein